MASAVSSLLVLLGAALLPAGKIRTFFVILGVLLVVLLVIVLRMIRPEQLVNPDNFASAVLYLNSMQALSLPYLPTTWVTDTVRFALKNNWTYSIFNLAISASCVFSMIFINGIVASAIYFQGFSRAQTTAKRLFSPLKTVYLQNVFSFLNVGLAAFVLSAIPARFVFPAVSMEGEAFWIIQSAPVSMKTFLWIKFFLYYIPLLLLSEILIVASNLLLGVTPFMMFLSVLTIFFLVPAVVALAVGLGACYPDFKSENPALSVTSFGGVLFMLLSFGLIALVIILEAGPVYKIFMARMHGYAFSWIQILWFVFSFAFALFLCVFAVLYPMRLGERNLLKR